MIIILVKTEIFVLSLQVLRFIVAGTSINHGKYATSREISENSCLSMERFMINY